MMRLHWSLFFLLGALLMACGGAPKALPEAEQALEEGRLKDAERLVGQAQGRYLTEGERGRVAVVIGRIAHAQVAGRARAAAAQPGWTGYEALSTVRRWYRLQGGVYGDAGDLEIEVRLLKRATALWAEVEPLRARRHYTDAVQKAADVLAPLPKNKGTALRTKAGALLAEARDWHQNKGRGALPGAAALHGGLANRFGATQDTGLSALRAEAVVAVTVVAGRGRCAAQEAAVVRGAARKGRRDAKVTVTLSRCGVDSKTRNGRAQYSYIEKVPYQVTERVRVRSERYVKVRKTCTRKRQNAHMSEGRVVKSETTTTYDCSVYDTRDVYRDRSVTKYRDVPRTGSRVVHTRDTSAHLSGTVTLVWDGGRVKYPVSAARSATDTAYASPHGRKGYERSTTTEALAADVLRAVIEEVAAGAQTRVRASDGAVWRARGDAAAKARELAKSEDADIRAAIASGLGDEASARLKVRYGLSGAQIEGALTGAPVVAKTRGWFISPKLKGEVGTFAPKQDKGEQILARGWSAGLMEMGLRGVGASDIPFQPDRQSTSVYLRLALAVLAYGSEEKREGWALYDSLMVDAWLGARISESPDYGGSIEEGSLAHGMGAGYQLMLGHRGKRLGLFGGLRAQNTYRRVGDFRIGGATYPLVARAEVWLSERHPLFVEAYGRAPFGEREVLGAEVSIGMGGTQAFVLRFERLQADAVFGGLSPTDDVDLGQHPSWMSDVGYGYQF